MKSTIILSSKNEKFKPNPDNRKVIFIGQIDRGSIGILLALIDGRGDRTHLKILLSNHSVSIDSFSTSIEIENIQQEDLDNLISAFQHAKSILNNINESNEPPTHYNNPIDKMD